MRHRSLHEALRAVAGVAVAAVALLTIGALPAQAAPAPIEAGALRVVDENGAGVEGAVVTIIAAAEGAFGTELKAATGADGLLELATVPGFSADSNPYVVWVAANGDSGYWDGTQDFDSTVPITIVDGGPLITATVRANNPPDGASAGISGTVTDALTGAVLLGVGVVASDDGPGGDNQGAAQSGLDGTYFLNFSGGELPSTAAVRFDAELTSADAPYGYAGQFYDDISDTSGLPETPVPVSAGVTTPDIDAALMPNGLISGVVTDKGQPLADAQVSAWGTETDAVVAAGFTGSDGSYSFPAPPGSYQVQFQKIVDGNPVATLWFFDVPTQAEGTVIDVVTKAATTGIDANFEAPAPPTPTPTPTPAPTSTQTAAPRPALANSGGPDLTVAAILGLSVVAAGVGFVLIGRRRARRAR